jgi:hypothetical protein
VASSASSKPASSEEWNGRLRVARDFKRDAEDLLALREAEDNASGAVSLIVNAAIAYGDALTGRYGGFFNQQDHRNVTVAINRALGQRADKDQVKRLAAILAYKDAASYGARRISGQKARELLEQLTRFSAWVEGELRR